MPVSNLQPFPRAAQFMRLFRAYAYVFLHNDVNLARGANLSCARLMHTCADLYAGHNDTGQLNFCN